MHLVARWGLAIAVSAGAFAVSWWVCQEQVRLDEGAALGIAGAVLAVVLAVAGWWAARERSSVDSSAGGRQVIQKACAGKDVNIVGGDQTINYYRSRDE
jgi:hypothetical protein